MGGFTDSFVRIAAWMLTCWPHCPRHQDPPRTQWDIGGVGWALWPSILENLGGMHSFSVTVRESIQHLCIGHPWLYSIPVVANCIPGWRNACYPNPHLCHDAIYSYNCCIFGKTYIVVHYICGYYEGPLLCGHGCQHMYIGVLWDKYWSSCQSGMTSLTFHVRPSIANMPLCGFDQSW